MTTSTRQPSEAPSKKTPTIAEKQTRVRAVNFWRSASLSIVASGAGARGDDFRADLGTSEQLIHSLLLCRSVSPDFNPTTGKWDIGEGKCVDGDTDRYGKPQLSHVAYNSKLPVVCVAWPGSDGVVRPWITDGRQKGRNSADGFKNRGAIETINHRLSQLVQLAKELDNPEDPRGADELQILTRNEAKKRAALCAAYRLAKEAHNKSPADDALRADLDRARADLEKGKAEGWDWATSASIAEYVGGRLGDERAAVMIPGLIVWRSAKDGGPYAIEYVCWTVFEPEDRDPAKIESLIASLALKHAQVPDPPSVEARRLAELVRDREQGGQGLPVSAVANMLGIDRKSVQNKVALLDLEPEVLEAMDAYARGEPGLSANQVRDGGFFLPGVGSGETRTPTPREKQLALIEALRGKRGVKDAATVGSSGTGAGNSTKDRSSDGAASDGDGPRKEISGGTKPDERHSADEKRAPVGPDSPTTAGIAKPVVLGADIYKAIAERISSELDAFTPTANGTLSGGKQRDLYSELMEHQLSAAVGLFEMLSGNDGALRQDSVRAPAVNAFRQICRDSFEEVLRSRGLVLRVGGVFASGAPVLSEKDRAPSEMIVTPRAGDAVGQEKGSQAADGTVTKQMGLPLAEIPSDPHFVKVPAQVEQPAEPAGSAPAESVSEQKPEPKTADPAAPAPTDASPKKTSKPKAPEKAKPSKAAASSDKASGKGAKAKEGKSGGAKPVDKNVKSSRKSETKSESIETGRTDSSKPNVPNKPSDKASGKSIDKGDGKTTSKSAAKPSPTKSKKA